MTVELVWKAAVLGISAALLGLLLQKTEPAQTLLLGLAAAGTALFLGLGLFQELRDTFRDLCRDAGISAALTLPVVKSLGITVVGRFSGEICRDAGQGAVASALETCSAAAALYAALPLVRLVVSLLGAGG